MKMIIAVLALLCASGALFAQAKKAALPQSPKITVEFVRAAIAAINAIDSMDGSPASAQKATEAIDAAKTIEEAEPDDHVQAVEGFYNFRIFLMWQFHSTQVGAPEGFHSAVETKYQACLYPLKDALRKRLSDIPEACMWAKK